MLWGGLFFLFPLRLYYKRRYIPSFSLPCQKWENKSPSGLVADAAFQSFPEFGEKEKEEASLQKGKKGICRNLHEKKKETGKLHFSVADLEMKLSADVAGLPASVPDETGVDLVAHAGEARAEAGHHGVVLASCKEEFSPVKAVKCVQFFLYERNRRSSPLPSLAAQRRISFL